MKYKIIYSRKAERFLEKLDKKEEIQLIKKIVQLSENPELGKPLSQNLKNYRSLRVGGFRVVYEIKKKEILVYVVKIDKRAVVYR